MATHDFSSVPAVVTITNVSNRIKTVQLFKTNTTVKLSPADSIKLLVNNSAELVYFVGLAHDELTTSAEAVTEAASDAGSTE